ncbi:melanoregulin-like isoform X2 [Siniperca chuatsi]|nr:melanoregulin-like isoform X2 [Siniperca chuatsi]
MRTSTASRQPEPLSSESSDSDPEVESLFGPQRSSRSPQNNQLSQGSTVDPWANTNRPCESPIRRGSDRELQAFLSMRDQADKATEEWEKLNYDIHTLRYARREVRSRWKKILLQQGYQCEVDALLCVNRQSRFSRDQEHFNKATELLKQLLDHTSLFPPETEHQDRYLYVMVTLFFLLSSPLFLCLSPPLSLASSPLSFVCYVSLPPSASANPSSPPTSPVSFLSCSSPGSTFLSGPPGVTGQC